MRTWIFKVKYEAALQRFYADHFRDIGKDNIIIVRKHTTVATDNYHDLPYYLPRIQQRKKYVKLRWLNQHLPDNEIIVELDPCIHVFN